MRISHSSVIAAVFALTLTTANGARGGFLYKATLLSGVGDNTGVIGTGVNASGQVAGRTGFQSGPTQAFLSGPNGGVLRDLGTLGGSPTEANGVNASGQVVGDSLVTGGNIHAFLSGANGGALRDLGTLGNDTWSYGFGVNTSGQVAGVSFISGNNSSIRAFLSGANGGALRDLGTVNGSDYSWANGVNDSGQVTGYSHFATGGDHAFLSGANGGALRDLGTLGGAASQGNAVNASGQVVGVSTNGSGSRHAFLSGANGGALMDLGALGGSFSTAQGVNASGQVVGVYQSANNSPGRAFLYSNTVMVDLNTLIDPASGITLTSASSISDNGFITGYGFDRGNPSGGFMPFLLTPSASVPEPSTFALLGVGIGFALLARVRVSRRSAR